MREAVKSGVFLLVVFCAFVHSCTTDNGDLQPLCAINEMDIAEKWWYSQNNSNEPALYFRGNGLLIVEGRADRLSFTLENCNKIRVTNLATHSEELWVIKSITKAALSIRYPSKSVVAYALTR